MTENTTQYKIAKSIPIPKSRPNKGGPGAAPVYPFRLMEVGHSIFVPMPKGHSAAGAARMLVRREKGKLAFLCLTREEKIRRGQPAVKGVRIWRTK